MNLNLFDYIVLKDDDIFKGYIVYIDDCTVSLFIKGGVFTFSLKTVTLIGTIRSNIKDKLSCTSEDITLTKTPTVYITKHNNEYSLSIIYYSVTDGTFRTLDVYNISKKRVTSLSTIYDERTKLISKVQTLNITEEEEKETFPFLYI